MTTRHAGHAGEPMSSNTELNAALVTAALDDLAQHLTDAANHAQTEVHLSELTLRKWAIIVDLAAAHIDRLERRLAAAQTQLAATSAERDLWERETHQAG